jgi:hypothetical protein
MGEDMTAKTAKPKPYAGIPLKKPLAEMTTAELVQRMAVLVQALSEELAVPS